MSPKPSKRCAKSDHPLLTRVRTLLCALGPSDNILIIHDFDPDGTASAALLTRYLSPRVGSITHVPGERAHFGNDALLDTLRQRRITFVITLDLQTDIHPDGMRRTASLCPLLIIDHHAVETSADNPNITIIKPQLLLEHVHAARH